MVDMKLTHEQSPAGAMGLSEPTEANGPKYPSGLEIRLDGDALRKLAIGESGMPKVGDIMTMDAVLEVVSISKSDNQIENDLCLCLQIQQMELEAVKDEMNEQQAAYRQIERLYE